MDVESEASLISTCTKFTNRDSGTAENPNNALNTAKGLDVAELASMD